jgi:hypothetical protein
MDMNNNESSIELLLHQAEGYSKTSLELLRLKTIEKVAGIVSSMIYLFIIYIFVAISSFILSIGIAIWIGELMDNVAFGYFIVGAFYLFLSLLFFIFKNSWIKRPFNNLFISQLLNKKTV